MLIHLCIACQHGQHDSHQEVVVGTNGLIGSGWTCPCKGDCGDNAKAVVRRLDTEARSPRERDRGRLLEIAGPPGERALSLLSERMVEGLRWVEGLEVERSVLEKAMLDAAVHVARQHGLKDGGGRVGRIGR